MTLISMAILRRVFMSASHDDDASTVRSAAMKIGLFAPAGNPFATPDYLQLLGEATDERGFDSIWVAEHVVLFDEYASKYPYSADGKIPAGGENGILQPFTTLSFLAGATTNVRLRTRICLVPQRTP